MLLAPPPPLILRPPALLAAVLMVLSGASAISVSSATSDATSGPRSANTVCDLQAGRQPGSQEHVTDTQAVSMEKLFFYTSHTSLTPLAHHTTIKLQQLNKSTTHPPPTPSSTPYLPSAGGALPISSTSNLPSLSGPCHSARATRTQYRPPTLQLVPMPPWVVVLLLPPLPAEAGVGEGEAGVDSRGSVPMIHRSCFLRAGVHVSRVHTGHGTHALDSCPPVICVVRHGA